LATKFNEKFFDEINTEEKAYWLGFLWCDGYVGKRIRDNNRIEYNIKLSLKESDFKHLEKFNNSLEGEYKINFYKSNGFKGYEYKNYKECRLFITNLHMGGLLQDKYGIIPNRVDSFKCYNYVPYELKRHFIRGVLDADGSFLHYESFCKKKNCIENKYSLTFGADEFLLKEIEKHLSENNIVEFTDRKILTRHKGKDGSYRTLSFSGKTQNINILNFLYKDSSIYLDRKYDKYLDIIKEVVSFVK
jgi:hypothetical protein